MAVEVPWFSGVRWFTEKRKGPVYRLELKRNWQDRYKRARVYDAEGELVGEIAGRKALQDEGAIDLPSGSRIRVKVNAKFAADEVWVGIDGREPVWREGPPATIDDLAKIVRRQAPLTIFAGAVVLLVGLTMAGAGIIVANLQGLAMGAIGAGIAYFSVGLVRAGIDQAKGRESKVVRALEAEKSPIGWFYGQLRRGQMSLVVHMLDGDSRSFEVPRDKWDGVLALFGARAPDAVSGFTPESEAAFQEMKKKHGADR